MGKLIGAAIQASSIFRLAILWLHSSFIPTSTINDCISRLSVNLLDAWSVSHHMIHAPVLGDTIDTS